MRLTPRIRRAAVTLTELLVVLVIIGILSTIAVPVYINQAERARVATAHLEVRELAQAMEACGITHGRYVPLQVLNDLPGTTAQQGSGNSDVIQDETALDAINFDLATQQLTNFAISNPLLSITSTDPRTVTMVKNWAGPFINFQRVYVPVGHTPNTVNKSDFPLDPWGNPYRFYSPIGIIGSTNNIEPYAQSDFDGALTTQDDRFDRWAIVSWGPDGQSDTLNANITQDDVSYVFGSATAETTFTP